MSAIPPFASLHGAFPGSHAGSRSPDGVEDGQRRFGAVPCPSPGLLSRGAAADLAPPHSMGPEPRSNAGIPPSLWMSSSASDGVSYGHGFLDTSDGGPPTAIPIRPTVYRNPPSAEFGSPSDSSKPGTFSELFNEGLFGSASSPGGGGTYTPPTAAGSPVLTHEENGDAQDGEELAKQDPLAAQVWKMYASTRAGLPQAQRMEHLTWRMMALAIRKKRDEEGPNFVEDPAHQLGQLGLSPTSMAPPSNVPWSAVQESDAVTNRGRTMGKGKAKVTVVGFDDGKQDPTEEEEYVFFLFCFFVSFTLPAY